MISVANTTKKTSNQQSGPPNNRWSTWRYWVVLFSENGWSTSARISGPLGRYYAHQPIIFMQCGPIRYASHNKSNHFGEQHQLIVKIKNTNILLPSNIKQFSEIYQHLMTNAQRNELILADVIEAFNNGRNPLLLTERIQHLDWFYEQLTARGYKNVFVLKGGLSKKARTDIMQKLNEDSGQRILLAIGKYIGEGFDDPKLDTLILALPISWHGTVQQYVGRLHREHQDKKLVMVYDYMDEQSQMLMRMYQKRVKKYQAMGYEIIII